MPPRRARSASRHLSPQSARSVPQPTAPLTRRTRATHTIEASTGLPPVTEGNEYQETADSPAEDEIQESPASEVVSDISSESQSELDALNYDLILESLVDLKDDAIKLLAHFPTTAVIEDRVLAIRDPSAPFTRRFQIQWKKFLATREAFGGRVWALPSVLVRKLRDGQPWADIQDGAWRPDAIFYLANLAQLVVASCLCSNVGDAAFLMEAFSFFPIPFSSQQASDRFTTARAQSLLEVGDEIRTQLFIHESMKKVNTPNFDPDELLAQVFFADEYADKIAPLAQRVGIEYNEAHQSRLKQIRSTFSKSSKNPIHFEKLLKLYPWDSFVFHVVGWAIERRSELEAAIKAQNGEAEGIVEAIRNGHFNLNANLVEGYGALPVAPEKPHMAKRGGGRGGRAARGGRVSKDLAKNIAALKNRTAQQSPPSLNPNLFENQENAAAAAALAPLVEATQRMDSGYAPAQDDESIPPSAQGQLSPTMAARQMQLIMNTMGEQERQANKENPAARQITRSYMDPQPGAERVTWNPDSDMPGPSGTKRGQPRSGSDDDDEDEFEEDARQPKRPRPNKGKGRAMPELSPVLDQQYPYPSTQPSYPSTRSPLREISRPPASTAPVNLPPASQLPAGTPYTSINQLAKQNVTATRERDSGHIVQQRKPWTEEEVHRLMDLIALNQGPKYAKILKDDADLTIYPDGPKLAGRNQVNLKDKARNVKMDYLKARQRLPDGFANVSIGKRMVEILRGMGIDYVEGDWNAGAAGAGTQDDA